MTIDLTECSMSVNGKSLSMQDTYPVIVLDPYGSSSEVIANIGR
jgi:hypothetical protein